MHAHTRSSTQTQNMMTATTLLIKSFTIIFSKHNDNVEGGEHDNRGDDDDGDGNAQDDKNTDDDKNAND